MAERSLTPEQVEFINKTMGWTRSAAELLKELCPEEFEDLLDRFKDEPH